MSKRLSAAAELARLEACVAALRGGVRAAVAAGVALPADALAALDAPVSSPALSLVTVRPRVGCGTILTCAGAHPGRVLIGERIGSHGAGKWALPGGHLEAGQSWGECAAMEVEEECGVVTDPRSWRLVAATNDPMPDDALHYCTFFMAAAITPEQAAAVRNGEPDKCRGWEWLTPEEVAAKDLFIPLRHCIEQGGLAAAVGQSLG